MLICRTERELPKDDAEKIALFCNVERRAVIEETDKDFTIYEVPLSLVDNKLDELIVEKLSLTEAKPLEIDDWRQMLESMRTSGPRGQRRRRRQVCQAPRRVQVGLRGPRSTPASPIACRVHIRKVEAEKVEQRRAPRSRSPAADGILVPGGFGERGIDGKIDAIRFARERRHSVLRHLPRAAVRGDRVRPQRAAAWPSANSTEFNPNTPHPVVCLLDEQRKITQMGGTMRLGAYDCRLVAGHARPTQAYGADVGVASGIAIATSSTTTTAQQFKRARHGLLRHQPRRVAGRSHRAARPSVVRGGAVPPGVQIEAEQGPPAVPRLRGSGPDPPCRKKSRPRP